MAVRNNNFPVGKEKCCAVNVRLMKARGPDASPGRRAAWGFQISPAPVHDMNSPRDNATSMLTQARICLKLRPTKLCQIMCCSIHTAPRTLSSFSTFTVPHL